MKKQEQNSNEHFNTKKRGQKDETVHLKHAPEPRGRNERQIDSDVEDI